ncbi:MAG TPA: hypothetical protein VF618_14350 [Thermoanaerobaculia bacterium]
MNDYEVSTRVPFVVVADEADEAPRRRREPLIPWVMQEEGEA